MKKSMVLLMLIMSIFSYGQEVKKDAEGFETFQYREGDTTYTMKKYFIVFLKRGENRSHSAEEAAEIQKAHLGHIGWMAEQGYLDIAGPFGDDGDIRGILVMRVPTMDRAQEIASMDPAVKAGRLTVEIHPWWAAEGSRLK